MRPGYVAANGHQLAGFTQVCVKDYMAKDIMQQAGGKSGSAVISIPESVKKNLPRDFDISAIGKIDLREAESIANEDIFLIREDELIEGLDNFDIIPLEGEGKAVPAESARADIDDRKIALTAEIERIVDRIIKHGRKADEAFVEETEEPEHERETAPVIEVKKKDDFEYNDGRKWISLEELDTYDEHGHKWMPLEELLAEGGGDRGAGSGEGKKDGKPEREAVAERHEGVRDEKPLKVEGYVESDDEYVIWDLPSEARAEKEKAGPADMDKKAAATAAEHEDHKGAEGGKERVLKEDEVVISMEDLEVPIKTEKKPAADLAPVEYADTLNQAGAGVDSIGKPERVTEDRVSLQYRDLISSGMLGESRETGKVYFIDDTANGKEPEEKSIFDESELDKIISGMVQVEEGSAYVLGEANVEEDRERIAVITDELLAAHEDLFVDLDFKYGDEELDYIHTAIVEEDYASYIREIDEFFGIPGGRTIPAAVELLGLTADEFDTIEDTLFQDEFKDIHLYDRYHLYEFDRASRAGTSRDSKNCRYLLPEENSLMDDERDSIESDVSSASALIFEEDIHDITEQLVRRTGKTEDEIRALVEKTFGIESVMEDHEEEKRVDSAGEEEGRSGASGTSGAAEGITDITDRVVILDNEADVERFVREFPEGKQMNIKMLLKYLDGLFETMPEEIIKKFASSEYFDLYLKVLNELDV